MSWFERQARGRNPDEVSREHARYVRAAGVDRALDALAGPFGTRRFLVHFRARGTQVRVEAIDAVPLSWGGGPPPDDPSGELRRGLERALTRLHLNMSTGPAWSRGAVGYVRDARGQTDIRSVFDEDADEASLDQLAMPRPPGHPLEDPAYLRLVAQWEPRMMALSDRTRAVAHDWDAWEVEDDRVLLLHYGGDPEEGPPPTETRRHRCRTLATFEPRWGRFTWRTGDALFPEKIFGWDHFPATWDAAMEVALLAGARLEARWLFVQPYDDHGSVLLVAAY